MITLVEEVGMGRNLHLDILFLVISHKKGYKNRIIKHLEIRRNPSKMCISGPIYTVRRTRICASWGGGGRMKLKTLFF